MNLARVFGCAILLGALCILLLAATANWQALLATAVVTLGIAYAVGLLATGRWHCWRDLF